jgi:rubrerythrin
MRDGRKEPEGSESHDNLKEAFAGESQANRRYGKPAHVGT